MSSKMKKKKLTVALVESFEGVVGQAIEEYRQRKLKKIRFLEERKRRLGPIPDDKLVLVDYPDIQHLDPREWKDQDHYAVLGLVNIRQRATTNQVKSAYRKLVLKHHPDKRRRKGEAAPVEGSDTDDYFSCIQKAFELLKIIDTRRAYDSIDPKFDESVPPVIKNSKDNFYKIFTPVFDLNQRWSLVENVPYLGGDDSTIEEVNQFYEFWYDFQSWREYSYLDEENKERAEDAMERRWMEKKNRSERATKKKEENARLRSLVDNAYASDPRIKRFKEEAKRKREAIKTARADAIRQEQEQIKADEEAIKAKKEEEDRVKAVEMKLQQVEAKKKKEREKKATKKARQKLLSYCKEKEWFYTDPQEKLTFMDNVNHLCSSLDLLSLTSLNEAIDGAPSTDNAQQSICVKLDEMKEQMVKEREQNYISSIGGKNSPSSSAAGGDKNGGGKDWTFEDIQILVKAVNLFPAGTVNRWKVVSNWINSHGSSVKRNPKDCLSRAKNLKESELKARANDRAFERFQESHQPEQVKNAAKPKEGEISVRYEADMPKSWSPDEQRKLEQALKTFPTGTKERWVRVAEACPGRTKAEILQRTRELIARIKERKAAAAASK